MSISCVTSEKCFEKFPPEIINTVDTISEIQYRDTIIEKFLPGDTVYAGEKLIIRNDTIIRHYLPVRAKTELSQAMAWIENNNLRLRLIQNDSILQIKLDSVYRIRSDTIKIIETVTNTIELKKSMTEYIGFWVLIIIILALITSLLLALIKL